MPPSAFKELRRAHSATASGRSRHPVPSEWWYPAPTDHPVSRLTTEPNAASAIGAFVTTKLAYFQEHLGFFAVYRSEAWADLGAGGALQSAIAASSEAQVAALAGVLEAAIATGEVRPVPTLAAAQAVFDLTRAVIERRLRGEVAGSSEDEAVLVADLLWKGFAA